MTPRTEKLRRESLAARPSISHERAVLLTEFYQENEGRYSVPVMRARSFLHLCRNKTIYLGDGELIVGERGPRPKLMPTFPELTCHSLEDLRILDSRPKTQLRRGARDASRSTKRQVIPYWRGRSHARPDVRSAAAGMAGRLRRGHVHRVHGAASARATPCWTTRSIARACWTSSATSPTAIAALDFLNDPDAYAKREALKAMDIACDAVILFAERHAELAAKWRRAKPTRSARRSCEKIADVCRTCPPTRRAISTRRCSTTGSATSR